MIRRVWNSIGRSGFICFFIGHRHIQKIGGVICSRCGKMLRVKKLNLDFKRLNLYKRGY